MKRGVLNGSYKGFWGRNWWVGSAICGDGIIEGATVGRWVGNEALCFRPLSLELLPPSDSVYLREMGVVVYFTRFL